MWPFCKPREIRRADKVIKQLVTGLIIGGAIGSVIGKHMMEKHDLHPKGEDDKEENDNTTDNSKE